MGLFRTVIVCSCFLFLSEGFLSCKRYNALSKTDYEWMPYQGNEVLVFTSNHGETDTIFFLGKDTLTAYPEAQSLNGITYEVVSIFCKHGGTDDYDDRKFRYAENYFLELEKSKDGKARLFFLLSTKKSHFYKLTGEKIDSLEKISPTTLQTNSKKYSDIYVIEDEDWMNFKSRSDYIYRLYWSKSEGLVRYDCKDSVYWELSKKMYTLKSNVQLELER